MDRIRKEKGRIGRATMSCAGRERAGAEAGDVERRDTGRELARERGATRVCCTSTFGRRLFVSTILRVTNGSTDALSACDRRSGDV
eukprot:6202971-Pleurochrysis_carterae.AAC.1